MKHVTFITTGQPTTNPRLVKEAETLFDIGYKITVICCYYHQWAESFDLEIINNKGISYIYCGGNPNSGKFIYFKTRIRQKLCQLLFPYIKAFQIPENAISRTHHEALTIAKKIKTDLYIAHNLGALPAAVTAARYAKAKVGYDAEDFYSGQFLDSSEMMFSLNRYVEENYFLRTNYFTSASPMISELYSSSYPFLKPIVLNNAFPKNKVEFKAKISGDRIMKLFWFSQTIGIDRGIEEVILAIAQTRRNIQFNLLGECSFDFQDYLVNLTKQHGLSNQQLCISAPIAPDEIFSFASQFDIGMATETGVTVNRNICLTNKIFTYIQSGLAVIASDTLAQIRFLNEYPLCGQVYKRNKVDSLADCLLKFYDNPLLLQQTKSYNYSIGQNNLNWETESIKFVNLIRDTLTH